MRHIRPHLTPAIRAQISPDKTRDRRLVTAGVGFLILSIILLANLFFHRSPNSYNKIALSDKQVLGAATAEPIREPATAKEEFTSYLVKNGDTLFNISQQYNIRWDLIAQINNLAEPYVLHGGQTLKIPQATTSKVEGKIYTIKKGDTLISIAKNFNITIDDIIAVNPNLQKSDLITVGQVIKLP